MGLRLLLNTACAINIFFFAQAKHASAEWLWAVTCLQPYEKAFQHLRQLVVFAALACAAAAGGCAAVAEFLVVLALLALWNHPYLWASQAYTRRAVVSTIRGVRTLQQTQKRMLYLQRPKALQSFGNRIFRFLWHSMLPDVHVRTSAVGPRLTCVSRTTVLKCVRKHILRALSHATCKAVILLRPNKSC